MELASSSSQNFRRLSRITLELRHYYYYCYFIAVGVVVVQVVIVAINFANVIVNTTTPACLNRLITYLLFTKPLFSINVHFNFWNRTLVR